MIHCLLSSLYQYTGIPVKHFFIDFKEYLGYDYPNIPYVILLFQIPVYRIHTHGHVIRKPRNKSKEFFMMVVKNSLQSQAYNTLKEQILSNILTPGTLYSETRI